MAGEPSAGERPERLVDLLDLEERGGDVHVGRSSPGGERVYGGQFLAQALVAATRSMASAEPGDGTTPVAHSLHAYFLRAGDPARSIDYRVAVVRDGRAFATREVLACQGDREVFRLLASFHRPEPGLDWSPPLRLDDGPTPDDPHYRHWLRRGLAIGSVTGHGYLFGPGRPVEVRYVDPPANPPEGPVTGPQRMWLRAAEDLGDDPAVHAAALAYLSDETLIDNAMLPHGLRWTDDRLQGASLDHAMWFCRPARADGWLLYEQTVLSTAGARAQVRGDFLRPDGVLVATVVQEGLVRLA